ncbi:Dyp-type peroxidase [Streptomyces sp. AV19]|uniref:Dyp-type peroxidase n=1 Tax=Streptomyces sp. AV19 TaxID=2793068 RepID=UPI0018FEA0B3|nr:Dyp-type peroxidase [Streptomyces sp. AV19]MBH1936635.1 Dyp-type peroxidase [Streptomyces sp. AV19]MDG4532696.1 Dyp-type peroxidase [Streptomyces sp. AV19]
MTNGLSLRENTEIQGDVIAGFKKDHVRLVLLNFGDPQAARDWVARITPEIATTKKVSEFNAQYSEAKKTSGGDNPRTLKATWLGLAFTYQGLRFLTGKDDLLQAEARTGDTLQAFMQGPGDPDRALLLGDTDDSDPKHWDFGSPYRTEVHAVLTVAADDPEDLKAMLARQQLAASQASASIVFVQEGQHLHGDAEGKEHFGFVDGTSQPGVVGFDDEDPQRKGYVQGKPGTRLIPAGEFVVGRELSEAHDEEAAALKTAPAWMREGSFQVVRRLEQDVPGWWTQVDAQLRRLKDLKAVTGDKTREWFAARLVGRWRDGTPVALCPEKVDCMPGPANDFGFADDPDGLKTPLFSHLRKTNPRDGLIDEEGPVDEKFMDNRRIMRRGIPYGQPFDPMSNDRAKGPDGQRGLTFVCYQSDLVSQFEFIQARWVNTASFPPAREHKPGPDTMVSGQLTSSNDGKVSFECRTNAGERQAIPLDFTPFVRTRGALYAFAPAISTLKRLALGDLDARLPDEQKEQAVTEPLPGQSLPMDAVLPVPSDDGRYWTFQQGNFRMIKIGATECGKLTTGDIDDSTGLVIYVIGTFGPALEGVAQLDTILPVPDEQHVRGSNGYWVFHSKNGTQVFRRIKIADTEPFATQVVDDDRPMSHWRSLDPGVTVDAFLPVPDMQPAPDGRYGYWVFYRTGLGQRYRMISLRRSGNYLPDKRERDYESLLNNWASLNGITRVEAFLPVPGKENDRGRQHLWVFHEDKFRVITVRRSGDHDDDLRRDDRPTAVWSRKQQ